MNPLVKNGARLYDPCFLIQQSQISEIQQQKASKESCSRHFAKPEQCLRIIPMIRKR
jgi:hypothetical protein